MKTEPARKKRKKPFVLSRRTEEILRSVSFYRYMTALDVAHLLYSPSSLTYVRSILSSLAGAEDFKTNQYLYRFQLPTATTGNREKVYTLGSKGRNFLAQEVELPVNCNWYFRPHKVKHLSYSQVIHNLILTRFLVAAHRWAALQPDFKVAQVRICYELAGTPAIVNFTKKGTTETIKVVPDAWLLFERLKNGEHDAWFPILLEIDRGMEYQQHFKRHVRSRIEFIKSGEYKKLFEAEGVRIAYATTGDRPEFRETRRRAMCTWTQEVLRELHKESWASIFRFHSLLLDDIYEARMFQKSVWYRPDSSLPVPLFAP